MQRAKAGPSIFPRCQPASGQRVLCGRPAGQLAHGCPCPCVCEPVPLRLRIPPLLGSFPSTCAASAPTCMSRGPERSADGGRGPQLCRDEKGFLGFLRGLTFGEVGQEWGGAEVSSQK